MFTEEQRVYIKDLIQKELHILLPTILKNVSMKLQEIAESLVINNTDNIIKAVSKDFPVENINHGKQIKQIITEHRSVWNTLLNKRKEKYWQYHRCVSLLDLYTECMEEEDIYIPRKFREDKMHTRNELEKQVIHKRSLQNFQTECELLTIRKDSYFKDITSIDEEAYKLFKGSTAIEPILQSITSKYQEFFQKDIDEIETKWVKKIDGMRKAFIKDKKILKSKVTITPNDSSKSSTTTVNAESDTETAESEIIDTDTKSSDIEDHTSETTINDNEQHQLTKTNECNHEQQQIKMRLRPPKPTKNQTENSELNVHSKNLNPLTRPERNRSHQK